MQEHLNIFLGPFVDAMSMREQYSFKTPMELEGNNNIFNKILFSEDPELTKSSDASHGLSCFSLVLLAQKEEEDLVPSLISKAKKKNILENMPLYDYHFKQIDASVLDLEKKEDISSNLVVSKAANDIFLPFISNEHETLPTLGLIKNSTFSLDQKEDKSVMHHEKENFFLPDDKIVEDVLLKDVNFSKDVFEDMRLKRAIPFKSKDLEKKDMDKVKENNITFLAKSFFYNPIYSSSSKKYFNARESVEHKNTLDNSYDVFLLNIEKNKDSDMDNTYSHNNLFKIEEFLEETHNATHEKKKQFLNQKNILHDAVVVDMPSFIKSNAKMISFNFIKSNNKDMHHVIFDYFTKSLKGGKQEFVFKINPEALGEIKARFFVDKKNVQIEFFSEKPYVNAVISENIDKLKEIFSQNNFSLDKVGFFLKEEVLGEPVFSEQTSFSQEGFREKQQHNPKNDFLDLEEWQQQRSFYGLKPIHMLSVYRAQN